MRQSNCVLWVSERSKISLKANDTNIARKYLCSLFSCCCYSPCSVSYFQFEKGVILTQSIVIVSNYLLFILLFKGHLSPPAWSRWKLWSEMKYLKIIAIQNNFYFKIQSYYYSFVEYGWIFQSCKGQKLVLNKYLCASVYGRAIANMLIYCSSTKLEYNSLISFKPSVKYCIWMIIHEIILSQNMQLSCHRALSNNDVCMLKRRKMLVISAKKCHWLLICLIIRKYTRFYKNFLVQYWNVLSFFIISESKRS